MQYSDLFFMSLHNMQKLYVDYNMINYALMANVRVCVNVRARVHVCE